VIEFDMTGVELKAIALGAVADQLPFILSTALNKAALETRQYLVGHTWPSSIKQKNPNFIRAALRIDMSKRNDLSVSIYDQLDRAQLERHATGGTKTPRGRNLAIPSRNITIGQHGVAKRQRPKNLNPKTIFVKGNKIFQRVGKGKNQRLKLMYFLKPSVTVPKDVPFHEDFRAEMGKHLFSQLPVAVLRAMETRR
jgi:hypothetical protein